MMSVIYHLIALVNVNYEMSVLKYFNILFMGKGRINFLHLKEKIYAWFIGYKYRSNIVYIIHKLQFLYFFLIHLDLSSSVGGITFSAIIYIRFYLNS